MTYLKNKNRPMKKNIWLTMILLMGLCVVSCSSDDDENNLTPKGVSAVDLGLPSGTKWASCNVGANSPEDGGSLYAWGEVNEKGVYEWSNYIHCDGTRESCHDIGKNISGTQYDVARLKWGGKWRMPTYEEFKELFDNCTHEQTMYHYVSGIKFTGKNGNSIFLPSFPLKDKAVNHAGYYWTGTQETDVTAKSGAYCFTFVEDNGYWVYGSSCLGLAVRPVMK